MQVRRERPGTHSNNNQAWGPCPEAGEDRVADLALERLGREDPLAVPWTVVEHLVAQLGVEDPSVVKRYTERPKTAYEHAWEIRDAYGYRPYEDAEWGRRFRMFLHGRACRARGRRRLGRWCRPAPRRRWGR